MVDCGTPVASCVTVTPSTWKALSNSPCARCTDPLRGWPPKPACWRAAEATSAQALTIALLAAVRADCEIVGSWRILVRASSAASAPLKTASPSGGGTGSLGPDQRPGAVATLG